MPSGFEHSIPLPVLFRTVLLGLPLMPSGFEHSLCLQSTELTKPS